MSSEIITKNDLENILNTVYPATYPANMVSVTDRSSNSSNVQAELNNLYTIGNYYTNSKSVDVTAGVDSYVEGAAVTIPAGRYILIGRGSFPSVSTAGAIRAQLYNKTASSEVITQGGYGTGWMSEQPIWYVTPSSETTYSIKVSAEVARSSVGTIITAVRLR